MKKIVLTLFLATLLTACIAKSPDQSTLPTYQQVAMRYEHPSDQQLLEYCHKRGGKYEEWIDDNGSKNTYCMLPGGYGCDPKQLFQGMCDTE